MEPLDPLVDHVRGDPDGRAYREVGRVESRLGGKLRFTFRHFPLSDIHPQSRFGQTIGRVP